MAQKNSDRLTAGLKVLGRGLGPYVEGKMRAKYNDSWEEEMKRALNKGTNYRVNLRDPYVLLKTLRNRWPEVFEQELGNERRALVYEVFNIRNALFHFVSSSNSDHRQSDEDTNLEDTYGFLHSIYRLLSAIAAPEAMEIQKLKAEVIEQMHAESSAIGEPAIPTPPTQRWGQPPRQPTHPSQSFVYFDNGPLEPAATSKLARQAKRDPSPGDPYTHFHPAYLLTPMLIRRLDTEVSKREQRRRGWLLIDAGSKNPSAVWVHVRPYVNDHTSVPVISKERRRMPRSQALTDSGETLPAGFRLQCADKNFMADLSDTGYPAVFVRKGKEEISAWAYQFIAELQARQFPYFVILAFGDSEEIEIYEEDKNKPLPTATTPLQAGRIVLELRGRNQRKVETLLPVALLLKSDAPTAALDLRIQGDAGFASASYHFTIRDPGNQSIGETKLRVNVTLRAGKPDEIILESQDGGRPLRLDNWNSSQNTKGDFDGPVILHLIFDRTTLDDASWVDAFVTLHRGSITDAIDLLTGQGGTQTTAAQQSWNQNLRNALASRLPAAIAQFQVDTMLDLWWFADEPRDGIAPIDNLPMADASFAHVGRCRLEDLAGKLNDRNFDYATGFDLFDAIDEALEEVSDYIVEEKKTNHQNHVVLIVGDSPPPPSDKDDVLWQQLVERPVRTNARCSGYFGQALKALAETQVPVGWLFIRPGKAPDAESIQSGYVREFVSAADLRGQIFVALRKIPGLYIEDTSGVEDMNRALAALFGKVLASKSAISGIEIASVISA